MPRSLATAPHRLKEDKMTTKPNSTNAEAGFRIQHELENAISAAVEKARRDAAAHPYLGHPSWRRREDYYADVALHHLFLIACGADAVSQRGGDVRKASKILHVGGTIARGWQNDDVGSQEIKLPSGSGPSEEDLKNREELRNSAERLVSGTIMNALIEHVSKDDPAFRARVSYAIEARIPKDDSGSAQAEMFSEFVRASASFVLNRPSSSLDEVIVGGESKAQIR
jgi:Cdc6-like AAA superfamily ATPase